MKATIAVLPGDGIGPEVTAEGVKALQAVARKFGHDFEFREGIIGGCSIDKTGTALPAETSALCQAADAVLLGAVGGPKWDDPNASVRPEQGLFAIRKAMGLFANLRPVTCHPKLAGASPLRPERLAGVDLLILRELTGGLYFGKPSEERVTPAGREAIDTLVYTEDEIRRLVRLGFEMARGRRHHVTSVDKANVLATSRLWRKVVEETRADFPDVTVEHRLVDAAAMLLIQRPAAFDVIVTENLFGDILSDEASVLAGSLGMLPSASLGDRLTTVGRFGLYEPIHGSAPDIAGQGKANPIGTIRSAAMLLRWSLGEADAAQAVERAVASALAAGHGTVDLGRSDDTDAMTAAIIDRLPGRGAAVAGRAAGAAS